MDESKWADFEKFRVEHEKALKRIATATRKEHSYEDVVNEAWLMGCELSAKKGLAIAFLDPDFQGLLLSYLRQKLVHYTEKKIRNAVRLDRAPTDAEGEDEPHPLLRKLAANNGRCPLSSMIEAENETEENRRLDEHASLAAAYVRLLRHFDNRMRPVADHLLISVSYAYRRCRLARHLAIHQKNIPLPAPGATFVPGPWRRYRIRRAARQLAFDFDEPLALGP